MRTLMSAVALLCLSAPLALADMAPAPTPTPAPSPGPSLGRTTNDMLVSCHYRTARKKGPHCELEAKLCARQSGSGPGMALNEPEREICNSALAFKCGDDVRYHATDGAFGISGDDLVVLTVDNDATPKLESRVIVKDFENADGIYRSSLEFREVGKDIHELFGRCRVDVIPQD